MIGGAGMKLRMKKAACVLMSCLILWTGISDCYIDSLTMEVEAVAVVDDLVFYLVVGIVLGYCGYSVSSQNDVKNIANTFQSDLETGKITGLDSSDSRALEAKKLIRLWKSMTVTGFKAAFGSIFALNNDFLYCFNLWMKDRFYGGEVEYDPGASEGVYEDYAKYFPNTFYLDDSYNRSAALNAWLESNEITNHWICWKNGGYYNVMFFNSWVYCYYNDSSANSGMFHTSDGKYSTSSSSTAYSNSKFYVSSFSFSYNDSTGLCGSFSDKYSNYAPWKNCVLGWSGLFIYNSVSDIGSTAKVKAYGKYYDISSLYGKSLDITDVDKDTIPDIVSDSVSANPDVPADDLNQIIQDAVDEALEGKIIIDDTKDESGDSSEEDKNKLPVADLVGFLMDYLPSIKKDVNNVYNVLNNIDIPDYTDYFTRIIEYLNSIYNDVLDRLDTIIRTLDVIPGILRTLDTSSDDKADIPSFPDTMKITFSELINWDSIASHFQHDYENLVEQIKNITFNIDFPDLSILGTISGNILEIKNFFDIDYNEVEGEVEELQEEVKKKFPLLEIVAFFALLDAFTFDMEYPEITMDVPAFLSGYFDSETILLVDLGDYSEQLGFVRNIIRAAMYIYFAYYIATKHFDFHLSID